MGTVYERGLPDGYQRMSNFSHEHPDDYSETSFALLPGGRALVVVKTVTPAGEWVTTEEDGPDGVRRRYEFRP